MQPKIDPYRLSAVTFFLKNAALGRAYLTITRTNGDRPAIWLRDHAFFCPDCGEIWGRIVHDAAPLPLTFIRPARCRTHKGGSFLANYPFDPALMQTLPRKLMLYELSLFMEQPHATSDYTTFTYTNDSTGGYTN